MERIVAARQRLGELPEPSNGPSGTESQVREAVQLLSSVLGDLETVAKESKREEEAVSENESRLEILAETPKDDIVSIDDSEHDSVPKSYGGAIVWLRAGRNVMGTPLRLSCPSVSGRFI